ncbi:trypsin-like serine peptidase [Chitinophaga lutea]|nr:serine protease [Chitinophaga lutea]
MNKEQAEELSRQYPTSAMVEPDHLMLVETLADEFEPEEVLLEFMRRTGDMKGDTIFPPRIRGRYPIGAIPGILEKNRRLHPLTDMDVWGLLERSGFRRGFRVIIGEDNREEVRYNTGDLGNAHPTRKDMNNAVGVAAVVHRDYLNVLKNGNFELKGYKTLQEKYELCPGEAFFQQPATANCSAFAVNDSTLVTAGHCFSEQTAGNYYFIFDYIVGDNNLPSGKFLASQVYTAKSVKRYYDPPNNRDLCIVRLNRKLPRQRVRELNVPGPCDPLGSYYVIGCPGGVPLKLAGKAKIMSNLHPAFFTVDSDTYKGNSGSPVFNALTNKVEGYLIEGGRDYIRNPKNIKCYVSVLCLDHDCRGSKGEKVIRNSQFIHLLN